MLMSKAAEAEGKGPIEPESQMDLDEVTGEGLSSGLRRSIKMASKFHSLAFSNFKSFMPIPRKDELWGEKKI